ncbi:MAG: 50S ribosomal protein L9 [Coriobacteriia bacterium]
MKVILMSDVKGRGKEGDVIDVARGFATNYLLPRNMAVLATPGNIKQLEARMHNIHKREATKRAEAESLAAQVSGKSLVVEAKAGEGGKLFGSITAGMVADALAAQLGVDVDRRKLDLHGHIKNLGEHTIDVRIYEDVKVQLVVNVVPEGAAAAVAERPAAVAEEPLAEELEIEAEVAEEEIVASEGGSDEDQA